MANYIAINKAEIRTLIPHSDLMCLLDEVVQWDDRSIACVSNTHRDRQTRCAARGVCPPCTPSNMVRKRRLFTAVCGRALRVPSRHPGYLAALRDGHLHVTRLDYIHLPLRFSRRVFTAKAQIWFTSLSSRRGGAGSGRAGDNVQRAVAASL